MQHAIAPFIHFGTSPLLTIALLIHFGTSPLVTIAALLALRELST